PMPDGIAMDFSAGYQALTLAAAWIGWIGAGPLAWLVLRLFGARPPLAGLVRLACGASLVLVWTFPLAFLMRSPGASAGLTLLREFLFALVFAIGARPLLEQGMRRGAWVLVALILLPVWSIGMQFLPEWKNLSRLSMKNPSTGLVAPLRGSVPEGTFRVARWTLHGKSEEGLSQERLALGERQAVVRVGPGVTVVDVHADRPTEDSSGLPVVPSEAAASLAAAVPDGTPNERLHNLHTLVRSRIRYERTYFPGDVGQILERGSGDCKAYAQVFAEGAAAMGFQTRVVRGMLARPDGFWAHAWASVRVDGHWNDWDPTSPIPMPDARYLRFSPPKQASSVFEGEMAIFTLDSLRIEPLR
ncbi:MAG: hypothetical protein RL318_1120, partial [Fibrobacterota bacterium]